MDLRSERWQAECVDSVHVVFGLMGCGGSKSTDTASNGKSKGGKSKEKGEDYLREPENDPVRNSVDTCSNWGLSVLSYIVSIAVFREEKKLSLDMEKFEKN